MYSDAEAKLLERLARAPVLAEPFAHCIVDDVFPADFYEAVIDYWPEQSSWRPLGESGRVSSGTYGERFIVPMTAAGYERLAVEQRTFWENGVAPWLLDVRLRAALLNKFAAQLEQSGFGAAVDDTMADALIVSDRTNYAIGPHTDAPHRVVSLLFYLPEDATFRRFGTSLYRPLDPNFKCRGGPHHPFRLFHREKTVEFVPNRLLVFPKSERCFHGVERVDLAGIERRLLIYNVRRRS